MFHKPGCPWCEAWEREIGVMYDKTDEAKRLPLRRLDVMDDLPASLHLKSPVNFTPTFVIVDQDREVGRIPGYPGDEFFWFLLAEMIKKLGQ
ncbi:thioredoxin domain-containing protein [Magnetospira thiophila]